MGLHRQTPNLISQLMMHSPQVGPRPRGRPPKSQLLVGRQQLEAAYHEKLTQHIQQTFLANQAYSQAMAVANGFPTRGIHMSGNGHPAVSGLDQGMTQGMEGMDNIANGRGNGFNNTFESSADVSPTDLVIRNKNSGNEMEHLCDSAVKHESNQANGNNSNGHLNESSD